MKKSGEIENVAKWGKVGLTAGPHSVGQKVLILDDERRGKKLAVLLDFPLAKVHSPVVIISHGAGGEGANMHLLTEFWASHGYACFAPTHDDIERMGDPSNPKDVYSPEGAESRANDLTLVIDSLAALQSGLGALQCRFDVKRIGIAGHSYGAYITMLIGGAVPLVDGIRQVLADARPIAFLVLSGAGTGILGLTENSWVDCHRPMMVMTGSLDSRGDGQGPEWRKQSFLSSPQGDKFLVYLEGARHNSFTGRATIDREYLEAEARIFAGVKLASLMFWDSYLKGDQAAIGFLAHKGLESASGGIAGLSRR